MGYFLTIILNTFKFWSYTDQYGNVQQPEVGLALMMWSITILFFYSIYCFYKKLFDTLRKIKTGILGLSVTITFYSLTLIFSALGGELPQVYRFQFFSNGFSVLMASVFWGLFCYFILRLLGTERKQNVSVQ